MFKTIHRSVLRELLIAFALSLACLNSVLMMERLLKLSLLLAGVGASMGDMIKILFFAQPQLLVLTLPMSLLLAVLLVFGRMNHDSEMIIMRTSGMSMRQIAMPVIVLGAGCFIASLAINSYIGPKSSLRLRNEIARIFAVRSTMAIDEGTFNTAFKNLVIIVKSKTAQNQLQDIFIYDNRSNNEPRVLMAKKGSLAMEDEVSIGLTLENGYMNIIRDRNTTELFFDKYRMLLDLDIQSQAPKRSDLTPLELVRSANAETIAEKKKETYLELYRRITFPMVCLLMIFLGPPLSMFSGRSGRIGGLAIGLAVFTAYYMLLVYGENLARAGRLPAVAGAFTASIVLGIFSLALYMRESRR